MPKESFRSAVNTVRPEDSGYYLESQKNRRLGKLAMALGTIAASIVASPLPAYALIRSAPKPFLPEISNPSIPNVGFYEQDIMSFDFTQDLVIAEEIRAAGGTDVEVRIDYTEPQSTDVGDQLNLLCTAAQAAQMNGLTMTLDFQTHQRGGNSSWVPTSPTELKNFTSSVLVYENALAGGGNKKIPNSCTNLAGPFKHLRFSIGGEPNYKPLFGPQYDANGNFVAPANAVHLIEAVAPAVQKRAKQLNANIDVSLRSFSPADGVINFVSAMATVIKTEGKKFPPGISFGVNGYWPGGTPDAIHPNLGIIGPADIPALQNALTNAVGYKPDIVVDEMGDQSVIPSDKAGQYTGTPIEVTDSEAQQAINYQKALNIYTCEGVKEVNFFHIRDDAKANPWSQSGILYADNEKKSSYSVTTSAIRDARFGNFLCSTK